MPSMLTKSRLIAFLQCPKRLWLDEKRPDLQGRPDAATVARQAEGDRVGEMARQVLDPRGRGVLIGRGPGRMDAALAETRARLAEGRPMFEAGFAADGVRVFVDALMPEQRGRRRVWRLVEVKSSTEVKDVHDVDLAIQRRIVQRAGLPVETAQIAHIDNTWTYPGDGDYAGLFKRVDRHAEAAGLENEVDDWIAGAQAVLRRTTEPAAGTGPHCKHPYPCEYFEYCSGRTRAPRYPVTMLPKIGPKLGKYLDERGITDLRKVPDAVLSDLQQRVKRHTLAGTVYRDVAGAREVLNALGLDRRPLTFLDFETVNFAVPIWAGTKPYQQIPFQFSLHRLTRSGRLEHRPYLDLSGQDPRRRLAEALVQACRDSGPVVTYNVAFERSRLRELADQLPRMRRELLGIEARLVDLMPVFQKHYYHPDQAGSWSLKAVLPTLDTGLRYDAEDGILDGQAAALAFRRAIDPATSATAKERIRQQLNTYCEMDTRAMTSLLGVWMRERKPTRNKI